MERARLFASSLDFYHTLLRELYADQNSAKEKMTEIAEVKQKVNAIYQKKLCDITHIKNICQEEKMSFFDFAKLRKNNRMLRLYGNNHTIPLTELITYVGDFYQKKFALESTDMVDMAEVVEYIQEKVNNDDASNLVEEITEQEMLDAINSSETKRAPGLDGLTYAFYKKHKTKIAPELQKLFHAFLVEGNSFPIQFIEGVITLIPKTSHPRDLHSSKL